MVVSFSYGQASDCTVEPAKLSQEQIAYLERQAEKSHQPWRLDSRLVARAAFQEWVKNHPRHGPVDKVDGITGNVRKLTATYIYIFKSQRLTISLIRKTTKSIWIVESMEHCLEFPIVN